MTWLRRTAVVLALAAGVIVVQGPAPDINPLPYCFFGCEPIAYMR
jgi:hypothetical protein